MFFVLFSHIFWGSSEAILKTLFDESESILFKQFFINFNFDFGVLAQKCLKLWVNGVSKFQFFFLNLFSKVLAGVGVRTSKYPYMAICEVNITIIDIFSNALCQTRTGPYSTGAVWWAASSGLEGFGNFGRLHYRIQEGGHLPYEG